MNTTKSYMAKKLFLASLVFGKVSLFTAFLVTSNGMWLIPLALISLISSPVYYGMIVGYLGEDKVESVEWRSGNLIRKSTGVLIAATGFGLVGFQIYTYLRTAFWEPMSLIDGLAYLGLGWAKDPKDWSGAWEMADKVPLSAVFILLGIYLSNSEPKGRKEAK